MLKNNIVPCEWYSKEPTQPEVLQSDQRTQMEMQRDILCQVSADTPKDQQQDVTFSPSECHYVC